MKQKYLVALSGMIVAVAVLVLTLIQVRSVRSGPQASTPTPPYSPNTSQLNPNDGSNILPAMSTAVIPKITDVAPNVPDEEKL